MTEPTLFGDDSSLPQPTPATVQPSAAAQPRLRSVERHQMEIHTASLDQLLPPDHEARAMWAYVEALDITPLLPDIKAVQGRPGRDANDPRVLFALWLYATFKGIGSARELDRLCTEHTAYKWLCGGMSVNYHSLADFRTDHVEAFDRLLTDGVAALMHEGLVELQRVAQDGLRVRASAGASSFRREPTLQAHLEEAQHQVDSLRAQLNDPTSTATCRQQAARQRAAAERLERVQRALENREQLLQLRQQQKEDKGIKFEPEKLRASTTDPEARSIKMPDGGTRPGYNVQFATTTDSGIVVGVGVTNSGGDGGQMGPMLSQLEQRYEERPAEMLIDGGFTTLEDIEAAEAAGTKVYGPIKEEAKQLEAGKDPYQPKKKDGPGVAAWRQRMGTEAAKAIYRERSQTAEWTNAQARNRGLYQFRVRGQRKVLAVVLLYALVHNVVRAQVLRAAREEPTKV